jgi:hypothetical protein
MFSSFMHAVLCRGSPHTLPFQPLSCHGTRTEMCLNGNAEAFMVSPRGIYSCLLLAGTARLDAASALPSTGIVGKPALDCSIRANLRLTSSAIH